MQPIRAIPHGQPYWIYCIRTTRLHSKETWPSVGYARLERNWDLDGSDHGWLDHAPEANANKKRAAGARAPSGDFLGLPVSFSPGTPIEIFGPHHVCDKGLDVLPTLLGLQHERNHRVGRQGWAHLFRSMQHNLSEQHFTSYEDIKNWLDEWIASKEEQYFFYDGIYLLPEKWQNVIANDGKYVKWNIVYFFILIIP